MAASRATQTSKAADKAEDQPTPPTEAQEEGAEDQDTARSNRGGASAAAAVVNAPGKALTADPQGGQEGTQHVGFSTPQRGEVTDLSGIYDESSKTVVTVKENVYETFLLPGATTRTARRKVLVKGQSYPKAKVDAIARAAEETKVDPVTNAAYDD